MYVCICMCFSDRNGDINLQLKEADPCELLKSVKLNQLNEADPCELLFPLLALSL
jgi:hypothetical protein